MGEESPEYLLGHHLESNAFQTVTTIDEKIYRIGGSEDQANLTIGVKVFDKLTGTWLDLTVFGTKPTLSSGHAAVALNNGRVLILKTESPPDDCIWFLEVDTPFVKEKKKLLGAEVVAWSKGVIGDLPKPIVISGPSGVGKGTLISKLMMEFPSTFGFSVSHTTRAPREKEINGVHYHFTERSEMEKDIQDGKFLEYALVHGNLYGTSIEAVEVVSDDRKRCILDIDVQGATSVRSSALEALFIFICPPSDEELEKRLRARGTENEDQVQKRLRNAKLELERGKSPGLFDHILVNDDLEACYQNLKKLLASDENNNSPCQQLMENFKIPISHSLSKVDDKISIIFPSGMFTLDVSSLKGGAPGRTRGLMIDPRVTEAD